MTSREKLIIMQAYLDGANIQFRFKCDNPAKWKNQIGEPNWDWYNKDYRVGLKEDVEAKYSIGDILVEKKDEGISYTYDLYRIDNITDGGYWFSIRNPNINSEWIKCSVPDDFEDVETNYVLMDDCLWYWENINPDKDFKYTYRWSKKELLNKISTTNIVPLYSLGFRLPKGNK